MTAKPVFVIRGFTKPPLEKNKNKSDKCFQAKYMYNITHTLQDIQHVPLRVYE